jgi:hypothetical protein
METSRTLELCASGRDPPDRHVVDVFRSIRVVRNPRRAIDPTGMSLLLGHDPNAENPWLIGGCNPIALDIRPNRYVDGLASERHVVSLSALVPIATMDCPSICPTKEEGCSDHSAWYGGRNNRRVLVPAGRTARNERVPPSDPLPMPNIPPPPIHPQEQQSIIIPLLHPANSTTPFLFDTDNSFSFILGYIYHVDRPPIPFIIISSFFFRWVSSDFFYCEKKIQGCVIWDLSTNHIMVTCHGFHLLTTPNRSASRA